MGAAGFPPLWGETCKCPYWATSSLSYGHHGLQRTNCLIISIDDHYHSYTRATRFSARDMRSLSEGAVLLVDGLASTACTGELSACVAALVRQVIRMLLKMPKVGTPVQSCDSSPHETTPGLTFLIRRTYRGLMQQGAIVGFTSIH